MQNLSVSFLIEYFFACYWRGVSSHPGYWIWDIKAFKSKVFFWIPNELKNIKKLYLGNSL